MKQLNLYYHGGGGGGGSVPDGKTVTPTDDVQTLLACAGITDKAYTTISEVLSDNATLYTVIGSNNAVDYLVRSTTWTSDICVNPNAMSCIGGSDYCANALIGDATWDSTICNSDSFDLVLNCKVPKMTNNTAPSGVCSSNSTFSGKAPYMAFDKNANTAWVSASNSATLTYQFNSPVCIKRISVFATSTQGDFSLLNFSLSASEDGVTFDTLIGTTSYTINNNMEMIVSNSKNYLYYRLSVSGGSKFAVVNEVQLYGRKIS